MQINETEKHPECRRALGGGTPNSDGRQFIIGRFVKTEPPPPITRLEIVQNWFAELGRLCPTRR